MLKDRIVVGVKDDKISESLQMDSSLTLSKAIAKVKLMEAVKSQQEVVRGVSNNLEALSVNHRQKSKLSLVSNTRTNFKCFRRWRNWFVLKDSLSSI